MSDYVVRTNNHAAHEHTPALNSERHAPQIGPNSDGYRAVCSHCKKPIETYRHDDEDDKMGSWIPWRLS